LNAVLQRLLLICPATFLQLKFKYAFILTHCAKNSVHTSISKSRIISSLWPEFAARGELFLTEALCAERGKGDVAKSKIQLQKASPFA
jgi:hypothetical protein